MEWIVTVRRAASLPLSRVVAGAIRRLDFAIRQATPGRAVRSAYGPKLLKKPGDITFYFCVAGTYGPLIPDVIGSMPAPFVFIDIGANMGLFSLIAARCAACERVVAIEPIPETAAFLEGNVALNDAGDRIAVLRGAVADTPHPTVAMRSPAGHSGGSKIASDGDIAVPVISETQIDRALEGTVGTILVKIDVEGAEPDVLAVLRRSRHYGRVTSLVVEVTEPSEPTDIVRRMLGEDGFLEVGMSSDAALHDAHFARRAPVPWQQRLPASNSEADPTGK